MIVSGMETHILHSFSNISLPLLGSRQPALSLYMIERLPSICIWAFIYLYLTWFIFLSCGLYFMSCHHAKSVIQLARHFRDIHCRRGGQSVSVALLMIFCFLFTKFWSSFLKIFIKLFLSIWTYQKLLIKSGTNLMFKLPFLWLPWMPEVLLPAALALVVWLPNENLLATEYIYYLNISQLFTFYWMYHCLISY